MSKKYELLISIISRYFENSEKGHDLWHALRVVNNAKIIHNKEGGEIDIISAAALLHDVTDTKFYSGTESQGIDLISDILLQADYKKQEITHVLQIIQNISFKGGKQQVTINSIEFQIVQDADRLDAMGAIGIARAFQYGGYKNREMYNPLTSPIEYINADEYRNSNSPTINHFYEKLLLLKDLMNTETAKQIANQRHDFMKLYLAQFYEEWGNVTL